MRQSVEATYSKFWDRYPVWIPAVTWAMRICIGALFLFSGFTKGIDVWGTIFKFTEYFSAWGYEVWDVLNVSGVFLLCLLEFLVGFFLIFGCFRRTTPIVALLIMLFMLPLSLWLAIKNPIADCGCFGDALVISNWATFFKNIFLTAGSVWLVIYNYRTAALITPYLQWIGAVGAGGYLLSISLIGYYYQPLIDFRPYKIGTPLVEKDEADEDFADQEDNMVFVYEKDGVRKEFSINDELPDEEDGWVFVERYYPETADFKAPAPSISHGPTLRHKNLRFFTEDGREDVTDEVIGHGKQLILMIPDLSEVSAAKTWKINSFYDWCADNDIEMLATVGGLPGEIRNWKDISLAQYPVYTSDDTAIKEVVRGNPGIVYIEDGIIKWKSALRAIDIDDFQDPKVTSNPMNFAKDDRRTLLNLTWLFLALIAILVLLSYTPTIFGLIKTPISKTPNEKRNKPEDAG